MFSKTHGYRSLRTLSALFALFMAAGVWACGGSSAVTQDEGGEESGAEGGIEITLGDESSEAGGFDGLYLEFSEPMNAASVEANTTVGMEPSESLVFSPALSSTVPYSLTYHWFDDDTKAWVYGNFPCEYEVMVSIGPDAETKGAVKIGETYVLVKKVGYGRRNCRFDIDGDHADDVAVYDSLGENPQYYIITARNLLRDLDREFSAGDVYDDPLVWQTASGIKAGPMVRIGRMERAAPAYFAAASPDCFRIVSGYDMDRQTFDATLKVAGATIGASSVQAPYSGYGRAGDMDGNGTDDLYVTVKDEVGMRELDHLTYLVFGPEATSPGYRADPADYDSDLLSELPAELYDYDMSYYYEVPLELAKDSCGTTHGDFDGDGISELAHCRASGIIGFPYQRIVIPFGDGALPESLMKGSAINNDVMLSQKMMYTHLMLEDFGIPFASDLDYLVSGDFDGARNDEGRRTSDLAVPFIELVFSVPDKTMWIPGEMGMLVILNPGAEGYPKHTYQPGVIGTRILAADIDLDSGEFVYGGVAGDLDSDGRDDIGLITLKTDGNRIHIFKGRESMPEVMTDEETEAPDYAFVIDLDTAHVPLRVEPAGDINRDGFGDLIIHMLEKKNGGKVVGILYYSPDMEGQILGFDDLGSVMSLSLEERRL